MVASRDVQQVNKPDSAREYLSRPLQGQSLIPVSLAGYNLDKRLKHSLLKTSLAPRSLLTGVLIPPDCLRV